MSREGLELEIECWQWIAGYEGRYKISNYGRVASFTRKPPKILKPSVNKQGYQSVLLRLNGEYKLKRIPRLVAQAFVPNPSNKPQVNHIDLVKTNNYYKNLEWMTARENVQHAIRAGVGTCFGKGVKHWKAILNEKQVRKIRKLHKSGKYNNQELSKMYKVDQSTIGLIIRDVTWQGI